MTPCREWRGGVDGGGYGQFQRDGKKKKLHRYVVEMAGEDQYGTPWNPDLIVMHLCDNPPCFRFDHLRLGTQAENLADMDAKGRRYNYNSSKTHCRNGHEFTDDNTYDHPRGFRVCRTCHRENVRRYKKRKRAALTLAVTA